MAELDKKDQKILELLTKDSRTSHNALAKHVALSKNSVTYRIERLKKSGIITGFFPLINLKSLGYTAYFVLIKINCTKEEANDLLANLQEQETVLMIDTLLGQWDYVVDFDCKTIKEFHQKLNAFNEQFSKKIETLEVHPILDIYKIEQLPGLKTYPSEINTTTTTIDTLDRKLLTLLNKNCTTSLIELGKELNVTYETVAARIKKLQKEQIIINFTTKIRLYNLGYEVYFISFKLRNYDQKKQQELKTYLRSNTQIRSAFCSSAQPIVFIYLAIKTMNELSNFLNETKKKFNDTIIEQNYLLSMASQKYEFFFEK